MQIGNCRSFVADIKIYFLIFYTEFFLNVNQFSNERIQELLELTKLFLAKGDHRCSE